MLRNSIEAFGFGKSIGSKKNYLLGVLPMADAFIAWSNAVEVRPDQRLDFDGRVKWKMHSISFLIFAGLGFWLLRKRRKRGK